MHAVSYEKFKVGDRVSVKVLNAYLGEGTVRAVSKNPKEGWGSPVYPAYSIDFDDGTSGWYNGVSLHRVN